MSFQKKIIIALCSFCIAATSAWGQLCVIAHEKTNVFYIGIENPISVAVAGVPSENIVLEGSGGDISITPTSEGKYNVRVWDYGETILTLKDKKTDTIYATHKYRCKRIPNPLAKLGKIKNGSTIPAKQMQVQVGLVAIADNFDFDIAFDIDSYSFCYNGVGESITLHVKGGRFPPELLKIIKKAKKGHYSFYNIRVNCPNEKYPRHINEVEIKVN
jgi:hypothetical protein